MTSMKSKTVLVTGGAGFIGSHVVERLIKEGRRVVVVDDMNDYYSPTQKRQNLEWAVQSGSCELVKGDIRSEKVMDTVMKKNKFDGVIHLAARAGVRPSLADPKLYFDTNVMGTLNILEQMRKHEVGKLVFASSSSVYGNREQGPFREDDNTDNPVSPYGASKKAMEVLCGTYAKLYGIKTVGLRFFTAYGPRNRPDMACYLFMDAISKGMALNQFGDGNSGRDYTYIDDIVDGIVAAYDAKVEYELVNLGNSGPVKLGELIGKIERVVGKKAVIERQENQVGDVRFTYADIGKAEKLFKWTPKVMLDEGLERMYGWYLEMNK